MTVKYREVEKTAVEAYYIPHKPIYHFFKRILDVIFSLLALIILFPILLITAAAIYIDDPGPVIYTQIRIGKDCKPFRIFKFRSMKINADASKEKLISQNQDHGVNFKMLHDPRVTRIGRFIRCTSIDELPQLLNILKGEMTLIGPRPFIEDEQNNLPKDRLLVKPGLSCYWQICGKNNLTVSQQIELDRKYIQEQSMFVDFKITIKTILFMISRKNR